MVDKDCYFNFTIRNKWEPEATTPDVLSVTSIF